MGNIKQIKIKNCTYYFFNDTANVDDFDWSLLNIDEKSYKTIAIYNNGYITIKNTDDYENFYSVNPLHLMIGHFEEKNGSKYSVSDSTYAEKWVLNKHKNLWDGIKNEMETINGGKTGEYGKSFMKSNSLIMICHWINH